MIVLLTQRKPLFNGEPATVVPFACAVFLMPDAARYSTFWGFAPIARALKLLFCCLSSVFAHPICKPYAVFGYTRHLELTILRIVPVTIVAMIAVTRQVMIAVLRIVRVSATKVGRTTILALIAVPVAVAFVGVKLGKGLVSAARSATLEVWYTLHVRTSYLGLGHAPGCYQQRGGIYIP